MEILVATIIFSIVSVVFLRSFVYALQMNEQAKQKQYSMILAQSLMESAKAYGLDTWEEQFKGTEPFKIYDLGATGGTFELDSTTGDYKLHDIVYQADKFSDRYKYDVTIEISPSSDSKHKAKLIKAKEVNAYRDAIYVEEDDEQAKLWEDIKAGLAAQGHTGSIATLDTSKISATRTVKVDISAADKVEVQSVYEYAVANYPITKADGTTANVSFTGTVEATDDPIVCYDKAALGSSVELSNLYIYYFPAYDRSVNQRIRCSSDEIKISNASDTLENIYVIKQKNPDPAFNDTEIAICESAYSPKVSISSPAQEVNLLHNLSKKLNEDVIVVPPPVIDISGAVNNIGKAPWEEKDGEPDTTLLYNVKVTVYKSGSSEPLCELAGSSNAK